MGDRVPDAAGGWHIALVGLPGAGKSTAGRELARLLERPFVDFDEEIERREGRTVEAIFAKDGEAHFRRLEAEFTRGLIGAPDAVLAPGGGWVTRPESVSLVRGRTILAWLQVTAATARQRMGVGVRARPLLMKGDPGVVLTELLAARERWYGEADWVIDTETLDPQGVARQLTQLASGWRGRVG